MNGELTLNSFRSNIQYSFPKYSTKKIVIFFSLLLQIAKQLVGNVYTVYVIQLTVLVIITYLTYAYVAVRLASMRCFSKIDQNENYVRDNIHLLHHV